jgi:hypothetical protein
MKLRKIGKAQNEKVFSSAAEVLDTYMPEPGPRMTFAVDVPATVEKMAATLLTHLARASRSGEAAPSRHR